MAGRYQQAADAADQVMKLGVYGLNVSYEKLFSYAAENNKEVLLDRQFIKDTYPVNIFALMAPYSQKSANSNYVPTRALVDMYETTSGKMIADAISGYDPANPYANRSGHAYIRGNYEMAQYPGIIRQADAIVVREHVPIHINEWEIVTPKTITKTTN